MLVWLVITYLCLTSCALCFWRLGRRVGRGVSWQLMCVLAAAGPLGLFLLMLFNIVGLEFPFVAALGKIGGGLWFFLAHVFSPVVLTAMLWIFASGYKRQPSGGGR